MTTTGCGSSPLAHDYAHPHGLPNSVTAGRCSAMIASMSWRAHSRWFASTPRSCRSRSASVAGTKPQAGHAHLATATPGDTHGSTICRHTAASIYASQPNTSLIQLKDRLGHASIRTTVDLYSHLYDNHDDAAMDALDAVYEQSQGSNNVKQLPPLSYQRCRRCPDPAAMDRLPQARALGDIPPCVLGPRGAPIAARPTL